MALYEVLLFALNQGAEEANSLQDDAFVVGRWGYLANGDIDLAGSSIRQTRMRRGDPRLVIENLVETLEVSSDCLGSIEVPRQVRNVSPYLLVSVSTQSGIRKAFDIPTVGCIPF